MSATTTPLSKKRKVTDDNLTPDSKKKSQAIDVKLKNEIIQKSSNKTTSESAKEYGLALSTISTIINPTNKAKISKL